MRIAAIMTTLALMSCGSAAPHPYPAGAQAEFNRSCPAEEAQCACTWDALTRRIPYEDYRLAMERFRADGLMDPRITSIRTTCLDVVSERVVQRLS